MWCTGGFPGTVGRGSFPGLQRVEKIPGIRPSKMCRRGWCYGNGRPSPVLLTQAQAGLAGSCCSFPLRGRAPWGLKATMSTCQTVELVFCPVPRCIHTALTRGGSSSSGGSERQDRFEAIGSSTLGARRRFWQAGCGPCADVWVTLNEEVKISRRMQRGDVKEG